MPSDLFPQHIESERLRYEPLHEVVDAPDLYEYHRTGEMDAVMQPLGEKPHATPRKTMDEVDAARTGWELGSRATYAITRLEDDEFVGVSELCREWEKRVTSFGTWIREPYWGRGYSGERAWVMLAVAFDHLDLEYVNVGHEPDNEQSQRAIEKYVESYGGGQDAVLRNWLPPGDFDEPRDLHTYSISQEQWHEHVSSGELAAIRIVR